MTIATRNKYEEPPMNYRIVRLKEVQRMTGLSRSMIYAQNRRRAFPETDQADRCALSRLA